VPFTRLPNTLFDDDHTCWEEVAAGRWRYADHITLGESRVVVRLVRSLAACSRLHYSKVLFLQDNMATAGAMAKGRSPSPVLNYLCRQRAASTLAARLTLVLPWTETSLMPADGISRHGFGAKAAGPAPACQSQGDDIGKISSKPSPFRGMVGGA
jgi:hypothetical protein